MSITIYICNFLGSTGLWERGPRRKCIMEPRENMPLLNVCFASRDERGRSDAVLHMMENVTVFWTSTTDIQPISTVHKL